MMIDKDSAHCDKCSNYEAFYGRPFMAIVKEIKKLGWRIFKSGPDWIHHCPDCVGKNMPKAVEQWWDK